MFTTAPLSGDCVEMAKYSGKVGHHLELLGSHLAGRKMNAVTYLKRCPPSGKLTPLAKGLPPKRLEVFHTENLGPYTAPILEDLNEVNHNIHEKISYMSVVSRRQATDPCHCVEKPIVLSESVYGSTSSRRLECLQLLGSISWRSERQSVKNIEPR